MAYTPKHITDDTEYFFPAEGFPPLPAFQPGGTPVVPIHEQLKMAQPFDDADKPQKTMTLPTVTLIGIDDIDPLGLLAVAKRCDDLCHFGEVKILTSWELADHPWVVQIPDPINSLAEYSEFCIKRLADYVDTEYCLIVQRDGYILNTDAWTDEFLYFDYVGAVLPTGLVGNGGFSLRSRQLLQLVRQHVLIGSFDPKDFNPEDQIICGRYRRMLQRLGVRFAPPELARRFADNTDQTAAFGFHGVIRARMNSRKNHTLL